MLAIHLMYRRAKATFDRPDLENWKKTAQVSRVIRQVIVADNSVLEVELNHR